MGVPPEAANRCVFSSILPAMTDAFSKLPIFWQLRSCNNIDNLEESVRKKERKKERVAQSDLPHATLYRKGA